MELKQNISRLNYLLSLYKMTADELLMHINEGLKRPVKKANIFSENIDIKYLKRIDKVFDKGLHFYLDPKSLEISKDASIFFRKNRFDTDLNFGARKIVNQFEELKISLSAISKLAEIDIERIFPIYNLSDNPQMVAVDIRKRVYPSFEKNKRDFLKALIGKFAEYNILVFEFVETWNKKYKANIDGFFLRPNVIVLKRQQRAFRREIFTLIHELGHYLLNKEEVEQVDITGMGSNQLSDIERWCNDFAFWFLAGTSLHMLDTLGKANEYNDYHFSEIENISNETHLSKLALFTRLFYTHRLSQYDYNSIRAELDENYRIRQEEENQQKELDKRQGIQRRGSSPKPINSPLLVSTIQSAYYEGIINEYEVCKTLNIKPEKLYNYIQ